LRHGFYATFLRRVRQRAYPAQWQRGGSCQIPVQKLWPPSPVCARRRGQGRAVRPSGPGTGRAQFTTQHRPRHRSGPCDGRPTGKKKRRCPRPPCRARGRKRRRKSAGKPWNWTRCGRLWAAKSVKSGRGWPWLAVERASRRSVAWVVGRRDAATARRWWAALPGRYRRHCWYFTDRWEAHVSALPRWQHRRSPKGSGGTSIVEAVNCALRQRGGVLVRKSCSFSKSLEMHTARSKIVIDKYNLTL